MSVMVSCAPGWGRFLRTITRMPLGQASRWSRSVSSATHAPSRISSWASNAGAQTSFGMSSSRTGVFDGEREAHRVRQSLRGHPVQDGVGGAGAVDPDQDLAPRPGPGPVARELSECALDHGEVVGGGVDPALPGRSSIARGSPVPPGPWSTNAHSGWNPKPRLNVGFACSFSECDATSVASRSTINGFRALAPWSGAVAPLAGSTSRQGSSGWSGRTRPTGLRRTSSG